MTGMTPELYRENMVVLAVLQALAGAVSSNVKALSLEFTDDEVVAHFILREPSDVDEEEIREAFPTEVAVLTNGIPGVGEAVVRPKITLARDHDPRPVLPGRTVFRFRD